MDRDGDILRIATAGSAYLVAAVDDRLHHLAFVPRGREAQLPLSGLLALQPAPESEVQLDDEPRTLHHGAGWIGCGTSQRALFAGHQVERYTDGLLCTLASHDPVTGVRILHRYRTYDDVDVIRRSVTVQNAGSNDHLVQHVSSASLHHLPYSGGDPDQVRLHSLDSGWCWEGALRSRTASELNLYPHKSHGTFAVDTVGSWSSKSVLPYYAIEDRTAGLCWGIQVEHSASWRMEVGISDGRIYTQAGLGNWVHAHWQKLLRSGESFTSAPVTLAVAEGDLDDVTNVMHRYRRRHLVSRAEGDRHLPAIYNDWRTAVGTSTQNTVQRDAAALVGTGVGVHVIDAGWYAPLDQPHCWWSSVGDWAADPDRFPDGLAGAAASIRRSGMLPGIWLEIEVAGEDSQLASSRPELFMHRHGRVVADNRRVFLDFNRPHAAQHAEAVFDRLVTAGFGYIKIDYNVDCSIGCDRDGDSPGQGLVEHVRAYYALLERVRRRHPHLVLESCASGGNRHDYGMLARTDLCSASDHGEWHEWHSFPGLISGLLFAVHPSQLGTWVVVDPEASVEELVFRIVGGIVTRTHLSGPVHSLDPQRRAALIAGLAFQQRWRHVVDRGHVYHHAGSLAPLHQPSGSVVLEVADDDGNALLAAWRRADSPASLRVHLRGVVPGRTYDVEGYPEGGDFSAEGRALVDDGFPIELPEPFTACVFGFRPR